MDKMMRYPRNDSYVAGWEWAGDSLSWMDADEVEDRGQGAAQDLGIDDAEMAYEGILDRVKAVQSRKK